MNHKSMVLEVKSFDEEQRYITGIATTPTVDRVGDVVEPMGAQFEKEIPLFADHESKARVGRVKLGVPTKKGIPFEAWIPKVTEPGLLKDRVDLAWHEVKYGLLKSVSIGFNPVKEFIERIENGWKYLKYEIFELSLVGVAAQADAKIHTFKSADPTVGATSRTSRPVVRLAETLPPVAGNTSPNQGADMKTIQERIVDFKSQRETEVKALQAIVNKSIESGQTLDTEDKAKHAEISDRIKEIDEHVTMLQNSEALMVSKATAVNVPAGDGAVAKAAAVRGSVDVPRIVQVTEKLKPGVEFAIYAKCLAAAKGNSVAAVEIAKAHYPNMESLHGVLKAAVVGGTTTLSGFASQLVDYQRMANEFLEYLMPKTVIGKFGQNGIPDVTHVPFNVELSSMTNIGAADWVGEGKGKPVTRQTYANLTLGVTKIAAITVLTDELIRLSSPRADVLTRDALAKAVTYRMNYDFLDPAKAAVSNVSPASITNGAANFAASGTGDAQDIIADMNRAIGVFVEARIPTDTLVWIMPSMVAMSLANSRNAFGAPLYTGMSMNGGTVGGIPVIVTDYVASDVTSGSTVVLVSAENILVADDGAIVIDASNQVSVEMQDVPTNSSATGTGASLVSMWQTNSTAFRAERWINWRTARTPSVVYITAVQWGEG